MKPRKPPAKATARERLAAEVAKLHRRAKGYFTDDDGACWPVTRCAEDNQPWPCRTAELLRGKRKGARKARAAKLGKGE